MRDYISAVGGLYQGDLRNDHKIIGADNNPLFSKIVPEFGIDPRSVKIKWIRWVPIGNVTILSPAIQATWLFAMSGR